MKPLFHCFLFVTFIMAISLLGCAETKNGSSSGAGSVSPSSGGNGALVNTGPNRVSQGSQGDTLDACLSRIPDGASDSQRMFATLTCERDAKARASIDAVPGQ